MDVWIFQADIFCDDCGNKLKNRDDITDTGDSDDYPQGTYPDGGGEADYPQHCVGCDIFLENDLTTDGYEYTQRMINEAESVEDHHKEWMEYYNLNKGE